MDHTAQDQVVITGIGVVTPIGIGQREFWENLLAGKTGVGPIQSFDSSAYDVHIGAEIKSFNPAAHLRTIAADRIGRCSQLALAAARLALVDADLSSEDVDQDEELIGVAMGTTMGESQLLEAIDEDWIADDSKLVSADLVTRYPCHSIAANLAEEVGARGPVFMIPTACAAGNYAIGYAYDQLKRGRAGVMLAGGADCFSRIALAGFARLAATAPEMCQPFDKNRKGMVVGEGAAVMVLEPFSRAVRRGAPVYAEVLGYGLGCDAYHMTGSHPEGQGTVTAMRHAFRQARIDPDQVDYVSAHGTGTPTNDRIETIAIKQTFGAHAHRVPVSSIKSMIGHTMGAASAIEAAVCALAVRHDVIPPTINYREPDPECDLDYVPNQARERTVRVALNNSSAFGGNNAVLLLGKA
jgi:3-oxoacyl-[acyl-carrier-protein] synthase II